MSKGTGSGAAINFWHQSVSNNVASGVILFVVVNLIDVFTTLYAISLGAEELNPLMSVVLAQGSFSFFTVKYLLGVLGVVVVASCCRQHRVARWALFYVLLPVYLIVVAHNLVWIIAIN